jgi:hypothetical protein
MRVKSNWTVEIGLTLKKRTITTIPSFQEGQAHPSQVLVFCALL